MQTLNTENLGDLRPVAGKSFQYVGLPLRIRRGSGSPIRAIAVLQDDD
jgi:kynurenine formamidase